MDKTNWKEKAGVAKQKMQAQASRLIQMCKENKKMVVIIAAFLVVLVGAFLMIDFSEKKEEAVAQAEIENITKEEGFVVPEEALEKDAYPEVNNLVKQYYQALVAGDIDTVKSIKNYTDAEEELKIAKKSEFIEGYPVITVYTKKGPEEGSYVAYVQYEVKFVNQTDTAPGLNTLYICTGEDGKLYINANELEEDVVEYLKTISVQNDVVDLFNTVQVAFNDIKTQNEELSVFLDELPNLLAEAVSAAMEEQKALEAASLPEEASVEPEVQVIVTKVKTTAVVNVRSSDSVEADKLGKTTKGQVLELIEERLNGWSKVNYEGKEGFIKTEYLVAEETEMVVVEKPTEETVATVETTVETETTEEVTAETAEATETTAEAENTAETQEETAGEVFSTPKKAKVTSTVKVREGAGTDKKALGTIYKGASIYVTEQLSNGWSKVEYKDKEAYVKSEYLKINE